MAGKALKRANTRAIPTMRQRVNHRREEELPAILKYFLFFTLPPVDERLCFPYIHVIIQAASLLAAFVHPSHLLT
jgi:hypothetical protein